MHVALHQMISKEENDMSETTRQHALSNGALQGVKALQELPLSDCPRRGRQ